MNYSWYYRKFFKLSAKILIIAVLFFGVAYAFEFLNGIHIFSKNGVTVAVDADGPINVWWPTDGSKVSNTQSFKAMVQDHNVSDYDMYWSVDGGQPNKMYDSSSDYPHKEAIVDLTNWTWKGSGPYAVTFSAVDHSGTSLGQTTVNISTPDAAQGPTTVQAGVSSIASAVAKAAGVPLASASVTPDVFSSNSVSTTSVQITGTIQDSALQSSTQTVRAIWPSNGASVQGTNTYKAVIDGIALNTYQMYWQVDGGQLNPMFDSTTDGAHKEASIDVSGWNWKGTGPYTISFVARNQDNSRDMGKTDIQIYTGSSNSTNSTSSNNSSNTTQSSQSQQSQVITQVQAKTLAVAQTIATPNLSLQASSASGNPFSGMKLYWDPSNDAKKQADAWRSSRPDDASQMDKIGNTPTSVWLGDWNSDVGGYVRQQLSAASSQGSTPVFVVYNIPLRDCGQYSSGGANNPDGYNSWIQAIANATGNSKAVFVLEPDAIALTSCLSQSQISDRYSMISHAVSTLKSKPNVSVYIDAGHPNWISADDMASRLSQAGIAQADGFALNTSNFYSTQSNIDYGTQISSKVGGKHFVIDTGRNGLGSAPGDEWCNPAGRALGSKPTANTGNSLVDAFLWLKGPGGSDGNCSGGPNAGVFWPDYALDIAKRSAF